MDIVERDYPDPDSVLRLRVFFVTFFAVAVILTGLLWIFA